MNPALVSLAAQIQANFAKYAPKAYQLGKAKAQRKYGIIQPWGERDTVNVELLLIQHAAALSRSMALIESKTSQGVPVASLVEGLISRASSWSWALAPALSMGLAAYVDQTRTAIAEQESTPKQIMEPNDIGIIWWTAEDVKVCFTCNYLSGRWFDAHHAYEIANTVHPGCRCPPHFDVGTPDEAIVGPIPGYKPGTADMVYQDLGTDSIIQARHNIQKKQGRGKPSTYARPIVNVNLNRSAKPKDYARPDVNI